MKNIIFFLIFFPIFLSCKKDKTEEPLKMNYKYFPYKVGFEAIYDVKYIEYNDFTQTIDTTYFQIKEFCESDFKDASGHYAIKILIYQKPDSLSVWTIKEVTFAQLIGNNAIKVEENIKYIKLVFPVNTDKKWNANSYNNEGEQYYEYKQIDKPYILENKIYDSTLTVLQANIETKINKKYAVEVYSKNIGLIYKKYVDYDKEVTGVIFKGIDYEWKLRSYKLN